MFILRCIFWLMVVYASMSWTTEDLVSSGRQVATSALASTATLAPTLVAPVVSGLGDLCHRQPARCLADTAKLTALIDAGEPSDEPEVDPLPRIIPLPVPDPRRHAHPSVLTGRP